MSATAKRTDAHRPSMMDPADYSEVIVFAYPGMDGTPGFNLEMLAAMRTGEPQTVAAYGVDGEGRLIRNRAADRVIQTARVAFFHKANSTGGCDVCGAHFRFGSVFVHVPTGEHILVGHDCADKLNLLGDRAAWSEMREAAKKVSLLKRERGERWSRYREVLSAEPRLRKLFRCSHRIVVEIRERFRSSPFRCAPSVKQVEFMEKLSREMETPAVVEKKVNAPSGRVDFEGVVVSVKTSDNDFGSRLVMTVKVETPDGRWLAWGTAPAGVIEDAVKLADAEFRAIQDRQAAILTEKGNDGVAEAQAIGEEYRRARGNESPLKGRRVSIKATLTPSEKDPSFAFFKRPNGVVIG